MRKAPAALAIVAMAAASVTSQAAYAKGPAAVTSVPTVTGPAPSAVFGVIGTPPVGSPPRGLPPNPDDRFRVPPTPNRTRATPPNPEDRFRVPPDPNRIDPNRRFFVLVPVHPVVIVPVRPVTVTSIGKTNPGQPRSVPSIGRTNPFQPRSVPSQ